MQIPVGAPFFQIKYILLLNDLTYIEGSTYLAQMGACVEKGEEKYNYHD